MNKEKILNMREKGSFGYANTKAVLEAVFELDKSIKELNMSFRKIKVNPKIQVKKETKGGKYKGLLQRLIRQNKLIIDILKVGQGIVPADEVEEEVKRLKDEIA